MLHLSSRADEGRHTGTLYFLTPFIRHEKVILLNDNYEQVAGDIDLKIHNLFLGVAAGAVLALAGCASHPGAQKNGTSGQPMVGKLTQGNHSQKVYCISHTTVGSHLAHTVCMTKAAYEQYQKASQADQQALGRMQNGSRTCMGNSSGSCGNGGGGEK